MSGGGGRKRETFALVDVFEIVPVSECSLQNVQLSAQRGSSAPRSPLLHFDAAVAIAVCQLWFSGDLSQVPQQQPWTFCSPLRAAAPELSGTRSPSGCGPEEDSRRPRCSPCTLALHTRATQTLLTQVSLGNDTLLKPWVNTKTRRLPNSGQSARPSPLFKETSAFGHVTQGKAG